MAAILGASPREMTTSFMAQRTSEVASPARRTRASRRMRRSTTARPSSTSTSPASQAEISREARKPTRPKLIPMVGTGAAWKAWAAVRTLPSPPSTTTRSARAPPGSASPSRRARTSGWTSTWTPRLSRKEDTSPSASCTGGLRPSASSSTERIFPPAGSKRSPTSPSPGAGAWPSGELESDTARPPQTLTLPRSWETTRVTDAASSPAEASCSSRVVMWST